MYTRVWVGSFRMLFLIESRYSPWPLPKLIYSYSVYLYSKDASSTLLSFFLFKAFYVWLFYLFGQEHRIWFDGLGNYDASFDDAASWSTNNTFASPLYCYFVNEPNVISVSVTDLVWALMGIILGWIQTQVIDKDMFFIFTDALSFKSVREWKKMYKKYLGKQSLYREKHRRKATTSDSWSLKDWCERRGLYPFKNICPIDWSLCYYGIEREKFLESNVDKRWLYRKLYWFYLVQLVLLGTPSTVVYTLNAHQGTVRSGTLIYYIIQLLFLFWFYAWNFYCHSRYTVKKTENNPSTYYFTFQPWLLWSKFNATYLCWVLTLSAFTLPIVYHDISENIGITVSLVWSFIMGLWIIVALSSFITNYCYLLVKQKIYKLLDIY